MEVEVDVNENDCCKNPCKEQSYSWGDAYLKKNLKDKSQKLPTLQGPYSR
jgi:hypothetical protein